MDEDVIMRWLRNIKSKFVNDTSLSNTNGLLFGFEPMLNTLKDMTNTFVLTMIMITNLKPGFNIPVCVFQMYVPLSKIAPNFAPVLEKLKVAPSILAVFLSVSKTLTFLIGAQMVVQVLMSKSLLL